MTVYNLSADNKLFITASGHTLLSQFDATGQTVNLDRAVISTESQAQGLDPIDALYSGPAQNTIVSTVTAFNVIPVNRDILIVRIPVTGGPYNIGHVALYQGTTLFGYISYPIRFVKNVNQPPFQIELLIEIDSGANKITNVQFPIAVVNSTSELPPAPTLMTSNLMFAILEDTSNSPSFKVAYLSAGNWTYKYLPLNAPPTSPVGIGTNQSYYSDTGAPAQGRDAAFMSRERSAYGPQVRATFGLGSEREGLQSGFAFFEDGKVRYTPLPRATQFDYGVVKQAGQNPDPDDVLTFKYLSSYTQTLFASVGELQEGNVPSKPVGSNELRQAAKLGFNFPWTFANSGDDIPVTINYPGHVGFKNTGTSLFADGSLEAPSIALISDPTTGFFRADDYTGFAVAGVLKYSMTATLTNYYTDMRLRQKLTVDGQTTIGNDFYVTGNTDLKNIYVDRINSRRNQITLNYDTQGDGSPNRYNGLEIMRGTKPRLIAMWDDLAEVFIFGTTADYSTVDPVLIRHKAVKISGTDFNGASDIIINSDGIAEGDVNKFAKDNLQGQSSLPISRQNILAMGRDQAGYRNLLINSTFQINQRGYAGTSASSGTYMHDRWRAGSGGCTYTLTGDGQVIITAGSMQQIVLGASIRTGRYILSWLGSASGFINGVSAVNGNTIDLTVGVNVTIEFSAGTLACPQLEMVGQSLISTSWESRPIELERILCDAYYQRYGDITSTPAGAGVSATATVAHVMFGLRNRMRIAPSSVIVSANADILAWNGATQFNCVSVALQNASDSCVNLTLTAPAASFAGSGYAVIGYVSANKFLAFQTEL